MRGDRHGLQLAASIAALPVTVLVLHILPEIKSAFKLSITSDGLIKLLRVHVPETQPKVTLQLDKTRIDCILVHLQHSDRPIYSSASARRGVHVRMKAFDHLYAAFDLPGGFPIMFKSDNDEGMHTILISTNAIDWWFCFRRL